MQRLLCLMLAVVSVPLQANPINTYYYQPQVSGQTQTDFQAPMPQSTYTFPLPPSSFFFRPVLPTANSVPSNYNTFAPIYLQPERPPKSVSITNEETAPSAPRAVIIRYEAPSEYLKEEAAPTVSSSTTTTTPEDPKNNGGPIPIQTPVINSPMTPNTSVPLVVINYGVSTPYPSNSSTTPIHPEDNVAPIPIQLPILNSPTTTITSTPLVATKYDSSTLHPEPASTAPMPPTPSLAQASTTPIMQSPIWIPTSESSTTMETSIKVVKKEVEMVIDSMINAISKSKESTKFSKTKDLHGKDLKSFAKTYANQVPITKLVQLLLPDMYRVSFEAENGIKSEELGYTKVVEGSGDNSTEEEGSHAMGNEVVDDDVSDMIVHVKSGEVTWTSPECIKFTLRYVADENGYHPTIEESAIHDKKDC